MLHGHCLKQSNPGCRRKGKTWAFLYRYFPEIRSVIDASSPGSINDPKNAMTLVPDMHREFGLFHFGFVHKGVGKIFRLLDAI